MLSFLVGLALTTSLLVVLGRRAAHSAADPGSMSINWVAAHRAGDRHSSL